MDVKIMPLIKSSIPLNVVLVQLYCKYCYLFWH